MMLSGRLVQLTRVVEMENLRIETARLLMRKFTLDDASDLFKVLSDENVMRFIEEPFDFAKTIEFIEQAGMSSIPLVYALAEKSSSKVIGHLVFHQLDQEGVYEIGWIIGKAFWGQGYSTEIGLELIRYGFNKMNLHKIVAETVDPVKSLGLMKKLGMHVEGIHRKQAKVGNDWLDVYWCGILAEDL